MICINAYKNLGHVNVDTTNMHQNIHTTCPMLMGGGWSQERPYWHLCHTDNDFNAWCGFRFGNDFWDGVTSKKCGMGDGVGTWYFMLIGKMGQVNVEVHSLWIDLAWLYW